MNELAQKQLFDKILSWRSFLFGDRSLTDAEYGVLIPAQDETAFLKYILEKPFSEETFGVLATVMGLINIEKLSSEDKPRFQVSKKLRSLQECFFDLTVSAERGAFPFKVVASAYALTFKYIKKLIDEKISYYFTDEYYAIAKEVGKAEVELSEMGIKTPYEM